MDAGTEAYMELTGGDCEEDDEEMDDVFEAPCMSITSAATTTTTTITTGLTSAVAMDTPFAAVYTSSF